MEGREGVRRWLQAQAEPGDHLMSAKGQCCPLSLQGCCFCSANTFRALQLHRPISLMLSTCLRMSELIPNKQRKVKTALFLLFGCFRISLAKRLSKSIW